MISDKDLDISVIYLQKDLSFEKLIPTMRTYIIDNYKCSQEERMELVANVKSLFDNIYKDGITMYSSVYGKREVDILRHVLTPCTIKKAHVNMRDEVSIIVINNDDIKKTLNTNENVAINKMFDYIEDFLKLRFKKD